MLTSELVRAAWDDPARLVPCLWGPPRRGKTWTLLAAAREYTGTADTVRVWRPALDLPEDMGGLLRVRGGRGYYSTPPGLPQACLDSGGAGWVLIIDEIDKARHDTLCTMLSLLDHQRSIRDNRLPHLRLACAGNQPDAPLPEALLGRMLHLQFPTAEDAALRISDYDADSATGGHSWLPAVARQVLDIKAIALPERVSGDDSLSALVSWRGWPAAHDPAVSQRIVQGLFSEHDVPAVLRALERDVLVDEDHLAKWIATAPLGVVVERLHSHVAALPAGAAMAALWHLGQRAQDDASNEMLRAFAALCSPAALAHLGPDSPDSVAESASAWRKLLRSKAKLSNAPEALAAHKCGHVCAEGKRRAACGACGGVCECATCAIRVARREAVA